LVYDDDDFDEIEDRWEPSRPSGGLPPDRPQPPSEGRRTLVALAVAIGVVVIVGVGSFIAGGAVGSHTDTVATTVTDVVTATAPPEDETDTSTDPENGAVDCAQGASKKSGYEPNDTADDAAGPLLPGKPIKGELREQQDVDYWVFCATKPTEVTMNLVCARGACDDLIGTFPADADFADTFATDKPLTCKLPRAGKYVLSIDSDVVPVIYRIGIEVKDESVIAENVQPNFPDGPTDLTC
jgi:hypothetical protein